MKKNQNNTETVPEKEDISSSETSDAALLKVDITNRDEEKISKVPIFLLLLLIVLVAAGMYFLKGGIDDIFQPSELQENTLPIQFESTNYVDPETMQRLDGIIDSSKAGGDE